jgi:hypothetical protein
MFLPRFLRGVYLLSQGLTLAGAASGGTGLEPALLPPGAGQPRPRAVTPRESSYFSANIPPPLLVQANNAAPESGANRVLINEATAK